MKRFLLFVLLIRNLALPFPTFAAIQFDGSSLTASTTDFAQSLNVATDLYNSTTTASLWQRANNLVTRFNNWLRDKAGVRLVDMLKAIGRAFVWVAKLMIRGIETLIGQ